MKNKNYHEPGSFENFPWVFSDEIFHYTCNPPKERVLRKYGIIPVGDTMGCSDSREVLEIPVEFLTKRKINVNKDKPCLILDLEKLMRELR